MSEQFFLCYEIFQMIRDRILTLVCNLKSVFVYMLLLTYNLKIRIPIKTIVELLCCVAYAIYLAVKRSKFVNSSSWTKQSFAYESTAN